MDSKIDMTYRFLWDSEPTDEQLHVIMEKVAEKARQGRAKIAKQMIEHIEMEYAIAVQQTQQSGKT